MNTTLEQQWQRVATRHGAHLKPPKQIDRGLVSSQDANIAKFCYIDKQPITNRGQYAGKVPKPSLNELLVANLGRIKDARDLTLPYIAKQCGLSQRTIGYYLDPDKRAPTRSGKLGSAKLNEIDALARGLGVSVWDLLGDGSAGPSCTPTTSAENASSSVAPAIFSAPAAPPCWPCEPSLQAWKPAPGWSHRSWRRPGGGW